MTAHAKKIIAPVIIVAVILLYYFIGITVLLSFELPNIVKISALIFTVIITIVFIQVLVERIKEIKQGEEDDLGKY